MVGDAGGDAGLHRVEPGLRQAPAGDDAGDRVLACQQDQRGCTRQRAAHRPRVPPPERPVVRSGSAPATGLEIIATAAPMPVTQPRTATLWADPAMAWTWLGRRTSSGPKYPRKQPEVGERDERDPAFPTF